MLGLGAKCGHVQCAEFSPVGKNRMKRGSCFIRSELEKAMARAALESVLEASGKLGIEVRRVDCLDYCEMSVRREG
jgi:hypothetical protein